MDGGVTPFLPQEIIKNILKRLPVKSLIRFQCVSKEWKNLIKTPSFIDDHLHHSGNQIPSLILHQNYLTDPLHLYVLDGQMQIFEVQSPPLMCSLMRAKIIGSSNGLVCIEIDRHGVSSPSHLLWNPSIREVRPLSVSMYGSDGNSASGFGFCQIVNDYKIVRTYAECEEDVSHVEVYSLSTGSWKEIEFENLEALTLFSENFSFNGAIFFYGERLFLGEDDVLVSFDMAMEVFNVIPLPAPDCNSIRKITVYDNKLAMVCLTVIEMFESSFVDLWVMEEGTGASGERWSWTKKYRSRTYPYCLSPMTTWRNEIICRRTITESEEEDDKPTFLCLFNISANESKFLTIHNISCVHRAFNYVESLVSVGNIHTKEPYVSVQEEEEEEDEEEERA